MDPTTCLQEILDLFSEMHELHPQDTNQYGRESQRYTCRCEVVDKLAKLGEYMITGGEPPELDQINVY